MIWELASLARASRNDTLFLIFIDILMIISGLIGALVCSGEKWAFFGFSILCFIPILTSLCQWDRAAQLLKDGDKVNENLAEGTGKMTAYAEAISYTALDIIAKSVFGFVIVTTSAKATLTSNSKLDDAIT